MIPLAGLLNIGGKLIDKLSFQGLFWCFPSSQPKINRAIGQPCFFTPLRYGQRFSKGSDKPRVSLISGLFFSGGPSAIFGAVSLLVINALNAKSIRSFAHVAQKISKIKPAITNCNSPAAVVFVSLALRTCASFFNAFPYLIRRRSLASQSVSV
jgi:hypothetical protein